MVPKEDPDAKKDRLRNRRLSLIDRKSTAQQTAAGLTSDLRAVYGLKGMSMFGQQGTTVAPTTPAPVTPTRRTHPGR